MTEDQNEEAPRAHGDLSPRDAALDMVPPERRADVLKAGADAGLASNQDAAWLLFGHALATDVARKQTFDMGLAVARAAQDVAGMLQQMQAATASIAPEVLKGASQAGRDTAGVIRIESAQVTEALKAAVGEAAKSAAARLAKAAAAQGPTIVHGWKHELAAAAWDFSRRSQWRNLASLLTLLALGAIAGAVGTLLIMKGAL